MEDIGKILEECKKMSKKKNGNAELKLRKSAKKNEECK